MVKPKPIHVVHFTKNGQWIIVGYRSPRSGESFFYYSRDRTLAQVKAWTTFTIRALTETWPDSEQYFRWIVIPNPKYCPVHD